MKRDVDTLMVRVVRFGLPALVLIFYVAATRNFDFAPEYAFPPLVYAADLLRGNGLTGPLWAGHAGTPFPLWVLFIAAGGTLGLDLLLTAKVFGIFFCCMALLLTFLIAFEVLGDRLMALCATLIVSTDPWLLQVASSGGAVGMGLVFSLATLFFYFRGERVLAVLLAGLATLVFWHAGLLFLLLGVDTLNRSRTPAEAFRATMRISLVYASVIVVWVLVARHFDASLLPWVPVNGEAPAPSRAAVWALLIGLAVAGVFLGRMRRRERDTYLRVHFLPLIWAAWVLAVGFLGAEHVALLALPLVVVYGFGGLLLILQRRFAWKSLYFMAFVTTALFLLVHQVGFYSHTRGAVASVAAESDGLRAAAEWVRVSVPLGERVGSDHPWSVSYYSEREVVPVSADDYRLPGILVTVLEPTGDYEVVYRPPFEVTLGRGSHGGTVSVWKKREQEAM